MSLDFQTVYNEYVNFVFSLSFKYMCNEDDANDVTQDVFVKVYKNLDNLKENTNLRSWLYPVVINTCKDHFKKQKRKTNLIGKMKNRLSVQKSTLYNEDETSQKIESKLFIKDVFDELPEHYKVCLLLKEVENLSNKEICDVLNIPMATLKTRLVRGKKLLARIIKNKGYI